MEDVLDLYHADYDPDHPVVCFDETSRQLVADKRPGFRLQVGRWAQRFPPNLSRLGRVSYAGRRPEPKPASIHLLISLGGGTVARIWKKERRPCRRH